MNTNDQLHAELNAANQRIQTLSEILVVGAQDAARLDWALDKLIQLHVTGDTAGLTRFLDELVEVRSNQDKTERQVH